MNGVEVVNASRHQVGVKIASLGLALRRFWRCSVGDAVGDGIVGSGVGYAGDGGVGDDVGHVGDGIGGDVGKGVVGGVGDGVARSGIHDVGGGEGG